MERIRVIDAVREVLRYTGHKATIELHPEMPVGPMNRVADNSLAKRLLGWSPEVAFYEGLHRTIEWYVGTKDRTKVKAALNIMLTER
jgi:nucleoside-diphosphate-sugar epimerase